MTACQRSWAASSSLTCTWGRPIAAPLERYAELLGVDLATVCAAPVMSTPTSRRRS